MTLINDVSAAQRIVSVSLSGLVVATICLLALPIIGTSLDMRYAVNAERARYDNLSARLVNAEGLNARIEALEIDVSARPFAIIGSSDNAVALALEGTVRRLIGDAGSGTLQIRRLGNAEENGIRFARVEVSARIPKNTLEMLVRSIDSQLPEILCETFQLTAGPGTADPSSGTVELRAVYRSIVKIVPAVKVSR